MPHRAFRGGVTESMPDMTRRAHLTSLLGLATLSCLPRGSARRFRSARSAARHRAPHPAPVVQRSGRSPRRRAGHGQPRPCLRRPHVQRRCDDPRRRGSAPAEAGRLLHGGSQHPHASPAGRRRSDAARQRREHRRDAVLRQHARLLREHARRQHHQPQEVPLGPEHPRHLPSRADAARSHSSRCPASASTGCGGRAGATPTSPRISTASPTTFCASST